MKPRDTLTHSCWLALVGLFCGLPFLFLAGVVHGQTTDAKADGGKIDQKGLKAPDSHSARLRRTMTHDGIVRSVAFSPDGKTLAVGGDDKAIHLWDVATGKERDTLTGHADGVLSLSYSPDGKTLASVSKDAVKLWDTAAGKESATLKGHAEGCAVAFSPDSQTLAEGSKDRTIKLRDVKTGRLKATLRWRKDWLAEQVAPLPKEEVAVAYSPDGKTLASGNVDKTIHLWDVATGNVRLALTEHVGRLTCLAFSPDGKTLASAGGPINLWDVQTGKQQAVLFGQPLLVDSLAFSPDGKTLASAGQGKTITLWDVRTDKERGTLTEQTDWITSVAFSPEGKLLASSSRHYLAANRWLGTVALWEMTGRERLRGIEEEKPSRKQGEGSTEKGTADGDDLKALQGTWVAVSGENSKEKFDKELKTTSVVFKGDGVTLKIGGDIVQATCRLDPSKKPRAIDMTITERPGKGEKLAGIYALEDGRLTICFGEPGQGRPTEFAAEGKPGLRTLLVLKHDR